MIHKAKKTQRKRLFILSVILTFTSFARIALAKDAVEYRVVNVREGSALNVRAAHDSSSADIGSASPGSKMYVVGFSPDKKWAKVEWDGGYGWTSTRFLSPEKPSDSAIQALAELQNKQEQPTFSQQQLTEDALEVEPSSTPNAAALQNIDSSNNPNISCVGNAPKWSLTLNKFGSLVFQAPDQSSLYANTQWRQAINNRSTYAFAVSDIKGTLLRQKCYDKHSEQNYGWQLELQTNGFGGRDRLSGCCTAQ